MAIKKLCSSVLLGAVAGGIYAMTDREVRSYVKEKFSQGKDIVKNPQKTIEGAISLVEKLKNKYELESNKVFNKVEQIENTLGRFIEKESDESFDELEE